MATFQSKSLSDEEIARQLDLCYNADLILLREANGRQVWHCPVCGFELHTVRLARRLEHPRPALVGAWSA